MSVYVELLEFAQRRPAWQQDLIRRICTQTSLSSDELLEVLTNLKASEGLEKIQHLEPVTEGHLSHRTSTPHATAKIAAIADIQNANQLASKQFFPLALNGITLVYGHNGSGKTGYARILKQLCRARRDKQEPLLGNVYRSRAGPARAKITYFVGDEERVFDWEDGKTVPVELSRVSVFDAYAAPLYADRQNEIEFLPLGLDVLPRLGKACEELAHRLQEELEALEDSVAVPLPQQIIGSDAHSTVLRLGADTRPDCLPTSDEIRENAHWSADDEVRLKAVEEDLQKFSEPARAAAQCRRFQASVEGFLPRLKDVGDAFNAEAVAACQRQFDSWISAREVAIVAARGRFDNDPLGKAIGSAAWRRLYEYAEKFNAVAYPGEQFPAVGKDRVCLLCQQPLGDEASERLKRFREFVEDTSQKESETQERQLKERLQKIVSTTIPTAQELDLQFQEILATEPSFASAKAHLIAFVAAATECKARLTEALNGKCSFDGVSPLDIGLIQQVQDFAKYIESKATGFDNVAVDSEATNQLRAEHTQLLGRQRLNGCLATVLSRAAELRKLHDLRRCREQCDTTQISRKNSEFREAHLTTDFSNKIKWETRFLGLEYLPIKIDAKTEKGTSYLGVGLTKEVNARNASILSEGEFRALALACFLAEIQMIPNHDGIIVDDPVSSLDHRHMKQVAHRLVLEAKKRPQVIVFTHDLSFYYELWLAAAEAQIPIQRNWVQFIRGHGFGVVSQGDGPWQVKKTKERIEVLSTMLRTMPPEDTMTSEQFSKHVQKFYGLLRETWERLIEERLLNSVVGRFQPGVMTQSLKGVSVTDGDYQQVFFAMKKVSEFSGHDAAKGREGALPTMQNMLEDLAIIKAYEKDLANRCKDLEERRRRLESPPPAETVPPPSPN
jgi:energy-coupling factor transporter ATP-binding protein EcfA2